MLNNLDVVLSFATIMLGVSLLIMVLTQTVSTVLNLRGRNLLSALVTLFAESGIDTSQRAKLAQAILEDPLLSDGAFFTRMAPAIRKEELLAMLDRLMRTEQFKALAGQLEATQRSIETWFQACMDRVSHKFAGWMRLTTVLFSFAMAIGLRLDSLQVLDNLSTDAALRASLAGLSQGLLQRAQQLKVAPSGNSAAAGAGTPGTSNGTATDASAPGNATAAGNPSAAAAAPQEIAKLIADAKGIASEFGTTPFQLFPQAPFTLADVWAHLWGILVSAVLLSLGAPFWFNVLGVASSLRPVLATKVEGPSNGDSP